jgi:hypothetical protein
MSNLNKIKLKQIDADFSGLVGQYGSGYFATIGDLNAVSGLSTNLVYTTGDQTISGIKTFANDVTILGDFVVSGATFINEVIDVTTTGTISGVTGIFQHLEADNILYNKTTSSAVAQPGDDLVAKYAEAVALTAPNGSPRSATNRASLVIFPGEYTLSETLNISASFVDVIGLGSTDKSPLVLIPTSDSNPYGVNVLASASDVKVVGIGVFGGEGGFQVSGESTSQIFENCATAGSNDFGGNGVYTNCNATGSAFNGSGTYNNCRAEENSFNGNGTSYTNCIGADKCFGFYDSGNNTLNGIYENCTAGEYSFGANITYVVTISGATFKNCRGGAKCFGNSDVNVNINGNSIFENCTAGNNSFGSTNGGNIATVGPATFTNCTGGESSFGADRGIASGTFTNCIAGSGSFASDGDASGTFSNCVAGLNSFGFGASGTLTGSLFYCRLTSGTYTAPTGSGLIRLCIDGNNDVVDAQAI